MNQKMILLILIGSLIAFSACSRADEKELDVKEVAADFSLETIKGETVVLSEVLKQKKVVLDFWASWCPSCVKSMPQVEKFYVENKDKVEVFGINIQESKAKVESFLQKIKASYPILLDSDGEVAKLYKVRGIPTVVAIDNTGEILYYGHSVKEMSEQVSF